MHPDRYIETSATTLIPANTVTDKTAIQTISLRDAVALPACASFDEAAADWCAAWDCGLATGAVSEPRTVIIPCFNPLATSHQLIG